MPKNSNQAITEAGSNSGVRSSIPTNSNTEAPASVDELAAAMKSLKETNALLQAELEAERAKSSNPTPANNPDDSLNKLANLIASAIKPAQNAGSTESATFNKSTDYKNQALTVDGNSLMESQQTALMFRNEAKVPISIPRSFANVVGPTLAVSVNGIRVSVPCDGKTHYINVTHAEHIKERLAKIDRQSMKEDDLVTIHA